MGDRGLPQLVVRRDEGFVDLQFAVSKYSSSLFGGQRVEALALVGDQPVGFAVTFDRSWKLTPGPEGSGKSFFWGKGSVESLGAASDWLVSALDQLYETGLGAAAMRPKTAVDVVGILEDPRQLRTSSARMKLFFNPQSQSEDEYAEVFLNCLVPDGLIQLSEKDVSYRRAVVGALGVAG